MKEEPKTISNSRLVSMSIIIVCIMIGFGILTWYMFGDWSKSGSFGDTFGALNSLFSGLAFAGIIYTILLQKKQLEYQLEELVNTREEMKLARVEYERAATAQNKQFENMKLVSQIDAINNLIRIYDERLISISRKPSLSHRETLMREKYSEEKKIAETKLENIANQIIKGV